MDRDRIEVVPEQDEQGRPTGQWYYRRIAGNGEIVNTSEAYTRKHTALDAAAREADGKARIVIVE